MKLIIKGKAPDYLIAARKDVTIKTYESDFRDKAPLLKTLLQEQGYICCYCMQRIPTPTNKAHVEHFLPESIYNGENGKEDLQFTYSNLFAACQGNEGKKEKYQHCDKRKKDQEIKLSPLNKIHVEGIVFDGNGRLLVRLSDKLLEKELNEEIGMKGVDEEDDIDLRNKNKLNLNILTLRKQRIDVIESIQQWLEATSKKKSITKADIEKKITEWQIPENGQFRPFCQVAIFYLQKKLRQYH